MDVGHENACSKLTCSDTGMYTSRFSIDSGSPLPEMPRLDSSGRKVLRDLDLSDNGGTYLRY